MDNNDKSAMGSIFFDAAKNGANSEPQLMVLLGPELTELLQKINDLPAGLDGHHFDAKIVPDVEEKTLSIRVLQYGRGWYYPEIDFEIDAKDQSNLKIVCTKSRDDCSVAEYPRTDLKGLAEVESTLGDWFGKVAPERIDELQAAMRGTTKDKLPSTGTVIRESYIPRHK